MRFIIRHMAGEQPVYRGVVDGLVVWTARRELAEVYERMPPRGPDAPPWDMVLLPPERES